jgi:uncharacterized membrane protein
MSTTSTPLSRPRTSNLSKHLLWYALGLAGISVLYYTDYPIIAHPHDPYAQKLVVDRFLLIPHAFFGILATTLGPFQFSTRFRQRHLSLHRLMGKVYIISIFITAPMALILGQRGFTFPMRFMGAVQPVLWFACTLAAFLTARNRHITVHRQWMIRSYAFTLNFIFGRFLNFIPAYNNMSETGLAMTLSLLTVCYFFIPDIIFNWREITTRRA